LRIYPVIIECVTALRPTLHKIESTDADLGRQMKRALQSVPLNVAEGSSSRGGNRAARYHTAAGSMKEVIACVDVAVARGYVATVDAALIDRLHKVVNTLKKVAI
jgi:four helix bundle protein